MTEDRHGCIISDEPGIVTEGSAWVKWVNKIEIKRK